MKEKSESLFRKAGEEINSTSSYSRKLNFFSCHCSDSYIAKLRGEFFRICRRPYIQLSESRCYELDVCVFLRFGLLIYQKQNLFGQSDWDAAIQE